MTLHRERETGNLDMLSEFSPREVGKWLIAGFTTGDFQDLSVWGGKEDFRDANFIFGLWKESSPEVKNKLKEGIVYSLNHWKFREENEVALNRMIYLTAYTETAEAIPALISMVDKNLVYDHTEDNGELDTKGTTISVLAGFAPAPEIKNTFERWLADPKFDPEYCMSVVAGLVECNPAEAQRYLEKFFELEKKLKKPMQIEIFVAHIKDIIGWDKLSAVTETLERNTAERLNKTIEKVKEFELEYEKRQRSENDN